MIITFCGHSDYLSKPEDKERLLKLIEKVAFGTQVEFYLGGYGNFDSFALKCAKKYKEKHKNTKLVFITPYLDKWLNVREDILKNEYDEIIYPEIENVPKRFAILKRNEWMIDNSDLVVTFVQENSGGAYKAMKYAQSRGVDLVNIGESMPTIIFKY